MSEGYADDDNPEGAVHEPSVSGSRRVDVVIIVVLVLFLLVSAPRLAVYF